MRRILLFLSLIIAIGCSDSNQHAYPATDKHIQVMGRHIDNKGAVKFGSSGVTFFMKFRGTYLDVGLEDEFRDSTNYNWFTVVIDSTKPFRFRTKPGKVKYKLADSLNPGTTHTLALSKATEGSNGHNQLDSVYAKELLEPAPLPKRKIEYIGDSITAGYGLDARKIPCDEGTWFDPTHAWFAYGPRIARQLNAQWMNSAVSGIGMHRNWNSKSPVMPDVYNGVYMEYTDSVTTWDFSHYTPDLVIIALGTNDFSDGGGKKPRPKLDGKAFVHDYSNFINTVQQKYPDAKFMLLNSPMLSTEKKHTLSKYLQRIITNQRAAGDSSITKFAFKKQYTSGCDGHPNFSQQASMAKELEPKVKTFMQW